MRSVFIVSFLAFIAVASGAYGILWYSQASAIKRSIEQTIDRINSTQKYITYDSIEMKGFPSDIYVSVVKPHFKGRIDQIIKNAGNPALASAQTPQTWDEDILLNGAITFGINALSDHYTLTVSGGTSQQSTINGQTISSVHQQSSDFNCILQMQRSSSLFETLWNYQMLEHDGKTLVKDFRMLDCNGAGQQSLDAATKGILSSAGPMRLYIVNTPQQSNSQVRFYFKAADVEITRLGDAQWAAYFHALSPTAEMPVPFSTYGKQNIDLDFTYFGPSDLQTAGKNAAIDIALNKFDITTQVYNNHTSFHYNNIPAGDDTARALSLHMDADFTEQYDTILHAVAHNFIKQLCTSNDPKLQPMKAALQKYTTEQAYAIIDPALPNLHSLGKVEMILDGNFKGNATSPAGNYTLNKFQMSATPYGIIGLGSFKVANNLPPEGTIQVTCPNCLKMIDDMADYYGRIQKVVSYFNPERAVTMTIEPAQLDAVKKFLAVLSTPPKGQGDTMLAYTFSSSSSGMAINGRPIRDVNSLFNEYVRPTLKQNPGSPTTAPAPAAGTAPLQPPPHRSLPLH